MTNEKIRIPLICIIREITIIILAEAACIPAVWLLADAIDPGYEMAAAITVICFALIAYWLACGFQDYCYMTEDGIIIKREAEKHLRFRAWNEVSTFTIHRRYTTTSSISFRFLDGESIDVHLVAHREFRILLRSGLDISPFDRSSLPRRYRNQIGRKA